MRFDFGLALALIGVTCFMPPLSAQDDSFSARQSLRQAIASADASTLDQKKTHPFHLHAVLAPSFERDKDSGRTGEIDLWWRAPGVYRRELRSPGFHLVEIVSGGQVWQRAEGDYLPFWLDTVSDAILHPLPPPSLARKGVVPDQGKAMMGSIYLNWEKPMPMDMQPSKQDVAIDQRTSLLFYDGGLGWGALFRDYQDFHGRMVPRIVAAGSPEVTAKVDVLEDLRAVADGWFDVSEATAAQAPLRFVTVGQTNLARDVVGGVPPVTWPDIPNTRTDGVIWTNLVLDREGRIREPFSTISDNPALNEFMHGYLAKLQFKPMLLNGQPVQSVRHVVLHFNLGKKAVLDRTLPTDGPG